MQQFSGRTEGSAPAGMAMGTERRPVSRDPRHGAERPDPRTLPSQVGAGGHSGGRVWGWSLACRLLGAAGVAAAGAVHFQLWIAGYHGVSVIGPLFLLDSVGSWLLALLLVATRLRLAAAAGIAVELGAIAGLALASTVGLFGFQESGFGDGGQILAAYATESLAALLLATSLALGRPRRGAGAGR